MRAIVRRHSLWWGCFLLVGILAALILTQTRSHLQETVWLEYTELFSSAVTIELNAPPILDFTSQTVDDYIFTLNQRLKAQILKLQATSKVLANPELFSPEAKKRSQVQHQHIQKQMLRLLVDREHMNIAWLDYHLFRLSPPLVETYKLWAKSLISTIASIQQSISAQSTGVFVHAGQIIGLQGCSGVCTGTHLHFATFIDGIEVPPCDILPSRQLSLWGVQAECGVIDPSISWPLAYPWIITQKYGDVSPVTNTLHLAIDVIDREFGLVLAAHSGWAFTYQRDCSGAVTCNQGHANIVTICENPDCRMGLSTSYWHLDWMLPIKRT